VRELQNVIERALILANGPIVQIDDPISHATVPRQRSGVDTLENVERNTILQALNQTRWVVHGKTGAAELLGINPSTLRSRMQKLGIRKAC
jgi:DNA-binding NtrC family response regulator